MARWGEHWLAPDTLDEHARFTFEITRIMAFWNLLSRFALGAIDHASTKNGVASKDLMGPPLDIVIRLNIEEFPRVVLFAEA